MPPPTVLVVDDDDDIRELTQLVLESVCGWNAVTADSGATAIDMCRTNRPDVVLLDMMMPGMTGLETFEHLQADATTRNIPVILLTAKGRVDGPQAWDGYAVRGVIAKPYDPMTLGDQVGDLLEWTKEERDGRAS